MTCRLLASLTCVSVQFIPVSVVAGAVAVVYTRVSSLCDLLGETVRQSAGRRPVIPWVSRSLRLGPAADKQHRVRSRRVLAVSRCDLSSAVVKIYTIYNKLLLTLSLHIPLSVDKIYNVRDCDHLMKDDSDDR